MVDKPSSQTLKGNATLSGTEQYAEKFAELHPTYFRLCQGLVFSSIGIGTYLGVATEDMDNRYFQSVIKAVSSGCNVIDTAINYRFQRSERVIGKALDHLMARGYAREEIIVCTKGGFIPFDGSMPADPYQWIEENLLVKGIVTPEDIHSSGHCMAPMYIYNQLNRSLKNLNVETIDVYYLHNPETQKSDLNEPLFYEMIEMAFRALENAAGEGKLKQYGVATWDGFLDDPATGHVLQLERLVECARHAGGDQHHFRMIQLPVNLEMTEALTAVNQKVGDNQMTLLEAASAFNLCVVSSASLLQKSLTRDLPVTLQQAIPHLPDDASRALQFARSIPGITTALVGMSSTDHVSRNLDLAHISTMSEDDFNIIFGDR